MADRDPRSPELGCLPPGASQNGVDESALDHRLREAFRALARPQLSPFFEARLRQRLSAERRQRMMRRCGRLMAAYWLASVVCSSGILYSLPWSTLPLSGALQLALVLVLATTAAPVWVLLRVLKVDLMDIIAGTLETGGPAAGQRHHLKGY